MRALRCCTACSCIFSVLDMQTVMVSDSRFAR
jgi:hypothetical protein